jgi:N-acetylmuramic acid 6-phosphate etherase
MLPRNAKLRARSVRIVMAETGVDAQEAGTALQRAEGALPTAIVMLKSGRSAAEAAAALETSRGQIAVAVDSLLDR